MSKVFEALKGLKHIKKYYVPQPCSATTYDYLEIIEQALLELKAIKESKEYNTIGQYILKAQEQEKVLNNISNIISKYMFESATVSNKEELKTNTINAIIKEVLE